LVSGFQTAGYTWAILQSYPVYYNNFLKGIAISLSVAIVIVLLLTGNIVLAIFTFISLASILAFVISMVHFRGWQMGIS